MMLLTACAILRTARNKRGYYASFQPGVEEQSINGGLCPVITSAHSSDRLDII
jgi:hypothetical protein